MVIPHTLIVILLLHLQALYNNYFLFFIIIISLFPVGVAGIAVTILRLLWEVDEGIESIIANRALAKEEAPLMH